jgi:hypothetical protein
VLEQILLQQEVVVVPIGLCWSIYNTFARGYSIFLWGIVVNTRYWYLVPGTGSEKKRAKK